MFKPGDNVLVHGHASKEWNGPAKVHHMWDDGAVSLSPTQGRFKGYRGTIYPEFISPLPNDDLEFLREALDKARDLGYDVTCKVSKTLTTTHDL